jgi:hypothetical protein
VPLAHEIGVKGKKLDSLNVSTEGLRNSFYTWQASFKEYIILFLEKYNTILRPFAEHIYSRANVNVSLLLVVTLECPTGLTN